MIALFPAPYPDELLYSVLARYCVRAGLYSERDISAKADIEFVGTLSPETVSVMTRIMPPELWTRRHTMFPFYAAFTSCRIRRAAFRSLIGMKGEHHKLLPIPKSNTACTRYLRYCPLCIRSDRERYGEAYWHRLHQIEHLNCCPGHGCRLIDSAIPINGKAKPNYISAELAAVITDPVICPEQEKRTAEYISCVFSRDISLEADVTRQKLSALFRHFSKGEQEQDFSGASQSVYEICFAAMQAEIPPADLLICKLPKYSPPRKTIDWTQRDKATLPRIRKAIRELRQVCCPKPHRITRNAVMRQVMLSEYQLSNMPLCEAEIARNIETLEEFRKRKTNR